MIVACPSCSRRYRDPRAGFRCLCGEAVPPREVKPFYPEIIRCAACGGNIDKERNACAYCGREVADFDEGRYCTSCFAFLERGGVFCSGCGSRAVDTESLPLMVDVNCPRDNTPLEGLLLATFPLAECSECRGVWMSESDFDRFVEEGGVDEGRPAGSETSTARFNSEVRYINCPVCGQQMARRNYERISGVIVDTCKDHGVWLDKNELGSLASFLRAGGLERSKRARVREDERNQAELERLRRGRPQVSDDD